VIRESRAREKSAKVVLGRVLINAQIGGLLSGQTGQPLLTVSIFPFETLTGPLLNHLVSEQQEGFRDR
jgi:hypothetical protein